jgi:hypothetical protein
MLDRTKQAAQKARQYVWLVLGALFPFADQLIAGIEGQLPLLAPYLGQATFRYMGAAIVFAKLALQAYRGWQQFSDMLSRKTFE